MGWQRSGVDVIHKTSFSPMQQPTNHPFLPPPPAPTYYREVYNSTRAQVYRNVLGDFKFIYLARGYAVDFGIIFTSNVLERPFAISPFKLNGFTRFPFRFFFRSSFFPFTAIRFSFFEDIFLIRISFQATANPPFAFVPPCLSLATPNGVSRIYFDFQNSFSELIADTYIYSRGSCIIIIIIFFLHPGYDRRCEQRFLVVFFCHRRVQFISRIANFANVDSMLLSQRQVSVGKLI